MSSPDLWVQTLPLQTQSKIPSSYEVLPVLEEVVMVAGSNYPFSFWKPLIVTSGEGNGTPLQYSCLENPMDGGVW